MMHRHEVERARAMARLALDAVERIGQTNDAALGVGHLATAVRSLVAATEQLADTLAQADIVTLQQDAITNLAAQLAALEDRIAQLEQGKQG